MHVDELHSPLSTDGFHGCVCRNDPFILWKWVRQVAYLLLSLTAAHEVTEALGQLLKIAAFCMLQAVVAVSYLH